LTIAVKKHGSFELFTKPTNKAGVPHVQAPVDLLATMLTVRFHLDAVTDRNGPLRVVPGSHDPEHAIQLGDREPVVLLCDAGDALLIRPLLLHASGHSEPDHQSHRRIVHLELASRPNLGDGYEWHDFVAIQHCS
jgi:ectoine hydroxylase-related dioxygenase (phytanoyl-CoA dioxygenase family)